MGLATLILFMGLPLMIGFMAAIAVGNYVRNCNCVRFVIVKKENGNGSLFDIEHKITDAGLVEEYRAKVGPFIAKFGGTYLTKGGIHQILEDGHWQPDRIVIVAFPDMAALNAWYESAEYQPLIALRQRAAIDMLITIEGA